MVDFNIGSSGLKTQVGYPASGSFVAFLMETYGLEAMKKVTQLEGRSPKERKKTDSWQKSFGKHLSELEKEWLYWLMGIFKFDEKYVQKHLKKASMERKVVKLDPEVLDVYAGQYTFSNDFIITISKDDNHLYIHAPGMGEAKLVPESESKFTVTTMDVSISFKKNAKGQVTHLIIHAGGGDMRAEKQK